MNERMTADSYDRGIIPAETAARIKREGKNYKQIPTEEEEQLIEIVNMLSVFITQGCQSLPSKGCI